MRKIYTGIHDTPFYTAAYLIRYGHMTFDFSEHRYYMLGNGGGPWELTGPDEKPCPQSEYIDIIMSNYSVRRHNRKMTQVGSYTCVKKILKEVCKEDSSFTRDTLYKYVQMVNEEYPGVKIYG